MRYVSKKWILVTSQNYFLNYHISESTTLNILHKDLFFHI